MIVFSLSNLKISIGRSPANTTVLLGRTAIVHLNCATNSLGFSTNTGYGVSKSWVVHSLTPTLAAVESSKDLIENGSVGYFLLTS